MTDLKFTVYSVLKNEDANPFINDEVLAIADGLGGSGSTVHPIDRDEFKDLQEELKKSAFFDFEENVMEQHLNYFNQLLEPMLDDESDTSALWASRIVITRFVYALLSKFKDQNLADEEVRKDIVAFIKLGLEKTADHFHFKKGKYDNQYVLPTTLAGFRYKEKEDKIQAEVLWAGDSRCYILTPKGLKQVSIDDENLSGEINNLFHASSHPKLNYKCIELDKPAILIAVSDGFFDPFTQVPENFGVEYTLLDSIKKSESIEQLKEILIDQFNEIHADDATMAFVPLGFANFEEFKQALENRTTYITEMYEKYCSNIKFMTVKDLSQKDIDEYIQNRIRDKYDNISNDIIECGMTQKEDVILSEGIKKIFAITDSESEEKLKQISEENTKSVISALQNVILQYDEFPIRIYEGPKVIDSLYKLFSENQKLRNENKLLELEIEKSKSLYKSTEGTLLFNQEKLIHLKSELIGKEDDESVKRLNDIINLEEFIIKVWPFVNRKLKKKNKKKKQCDFSFSKKLESNLDDLMQIRSSLEKIDDNLQEIIYGKIRTQKQWILNSQQAEFIKNEKKLKNDLQLKEFADNCLSYVKYDLLDYKPLTKEEIDLKVKEMKLATIQRKFNEEKSLIIHMIFDTLSKNYDKTSVVDCHFNSTKLMQFRWLREFNNSGKNEVLKFENEWNELKDSYLDFIKTY